MIVASSSSPAEPAGTDRGGLQRPRGRRAAGVIPAICATSALALAACSSGSANQAPPTAVAKACQQVGAVLSDGPDPTRGPVGDAEAQIQPLRQVRSADPQLQAAISKLASAYAEFFARNGKSAAAMTAVTAATGRVEQLCQGVAT
jgi:hypothetical protein